MRDYLVFQLYGPLTAWGDIAVGETRPSSMSPAKSAVLGLVAAALGLRRPNTSPDEKKRRLWEEEHQALSVGYGMAVKLTRPGLPLIDYHTAQVPSCGKGKNRISFATRRDELMWLPRHDLNTILSRREYRQDAYAAVALWEREGSPHPLAELQTRLLTPKFMLYLGRKSCPIGLPLNPQLVGAPKMEDAFGGYSFQEAARLIWALDDVMLGRVQAMMSEEQMMLFWDADAETSMVHQEIYTRRDNFTSRQRWQFAVREERRAHFGSQQ